MSRPLRAAQATLGVITKPGRSPAQGPCSHLSGRLLQLLFQLLHPDFELLYSPQHLSPLLFQGQHLSLELGAGGILVLEGRGAISLGEPRASQDETKKMDHCVSGHSEGAAGLRGGNSPPYKESNTALSAARNNDSLLRARPGWGPEEKVGHKAYL